ncbi:hypothetical protein [Ornithinibacillus halophilus]|uniref:Uncharacterized protein n=1 Tax=Ornithinibacillus halophilus TaxID=930117 RepID=A0A1M5IZ39_9BACI|nr:hypothetical protein [Ornithinibacillus halophilus]SHG33582.1 hypothetical protein SAMN05216225_10276 [Ornithinibacillus halophilus]
MKREMVEKREVDMEYFEKILVKSLKDKDQAFYRNYVEYIEFIATNSDLWPVVNIYINNNKWKEEDEKHDVVTKSMRSSEKLEIMFSIITNCREVFKEMYGETVRIDWITSGEVETKASRK